MSVLQINVYIIKDKKYRLIVKWKFKDNQKFIVNAFNIVQLHRTIGLLRFLTTFAMRSFNSTSALVQVSRRMKTESTTYIFQYFNDYP